MKADEFINSLSSEKVNTWFDLGLFIDRFREHRNVPVYEFKGDFDNFLSHLGKGGLAFLTFQYGVDGVSFEVEKYSAIFKNIIPDLPVHYLAGTFQPEAGGFLSHYDHKQEIEELNAFDKWELYHDFFFVKLQRGSKEYNALIHKFWTETILLCQVLARYVEDNDIRLLYLINVNSNPGNVALALATVLISEFMHIPVINNNHDFYWEGGAREVDIKQNKAESGPRDFFFSNSGVGEFFSQIDVLFPWESRSWITANINHEQSTHVISKNGHNPANVCDIGTAINTAQFQPTKKRREIESFIQVKHILGDQNGTVLVHSPDQVIHSELNQEGALKPVLIGFKNNIEVDFVSNNIVFLQPTRVLKRKCIEINFNIITRLLDNKDFRAKFLDNPDLTLTILATGPVPAGQYSYLLDLIASFQDFLDSLAGDFKERIFLGFLFSAFDKKEFKQKFDAPISIADLYNMASLILLPSETEGRGLPIIEAAACGTPICCRRYFPENVYDEVIGMHLSKKERLKVFEFSGQDIPDKMAATIYRRIFFPHEFVDEVEHNIRVIEKRYSLKSLGKNIRDVLHGLFLQLRPGHDSHEFMIQTLNHYQEINSFHNKNLDLILNAKSRMYTAGFGKIGFMIYLKSLIDPSFFRVEEQEIRGMTMAFAMRLVEDYSGKSPLTREQLHKFYNCVDSLFLYRKGDITIKHDHSLSYRHRNTYNYPYRDFTFQEITGFVNMVFNKITNADVKVKIKHVKHFFNDWNLALQQLTKSSYLAIDDRERLMRMLKSNVPIAYFHDSYIKHELEYYVLQPLRARLNIPIEEELTEDVLKEHGAFIAPIYIFCSKHHLGNRFTARDLKKFVSNSQDTELMLLYNYGLFKIIKTEQWCVGVHFNQMGKKALNVLRNIKRNKGFLIANGENSAIMTDCVDIDRFHLGVVESTMVARMMGIPEKSGFVQYVPAGIRPTLTYPTPTQTALDLHNALIGDVYKELCIKEGERKILRLLKKEAGFRGSPIHIALQKVKEKVNGNLQVGSVKVTYINGKYEDGLPWHGVKAEVNTTSGNQKWKFEVLHDPSSPKTVADFVGGFSKTSKRKVKIAWNGGYILNAELVGKLGLPETYIGSPLGLIITGGKVTSLPLFNKPALLFMKDGSSDIRRVNVSGGMVISSDAASVSFSPDGYNKSSDVLPVFYDLLYPEDSIPGDGNIVVRLAGNVIKEIIPTKSGESVKIVPVGLTLAFPPESFPDSWKVEQELSVAINGLEDVSDAIEAGPLLVLDGKNDINMEKEGWKTQNSIRTQAARLDYLDMRGPKIGVGINKEGTLTVLTVNGRFRDSVGATHIDMADILRGEGADRAMGFDPGGSTTLIVNDEVLNVSPYNSNYEEDIYSLAPQPRNISNAVLGYQP